MKSSFLGTLLLACLFCVAVPTTTYADGKKQYPDYNFVVSPPDGWLDTTASAAQKGVIASFGSPDHTRSVFVLVEDRAVPISEWDDALAAEFDRAAEAHLGKRLSGKFVAVEGIKSYERTSAPSVQGKTISMISRTTPVGTRFYSLQGYHFAGGNVEEDPQVREFLDSFHFLTPPPGATATTATQRAPAPAVEPLPPSAANPATATEPAPAPAGEPPPSPVTLSTVSAQPTPTFRVETRPVPMANSTTDPRAKDLESAFKTGQIVGRILGILLAVGVPIIIVWFLRRRKRRKLVVPFPSAEPPPSPRPKSPSVLRAAPPSPSSVTPTTASPPARPIPRSAPAARTAPTFPPAPIPRSAPPVPVASSTTPVPVTPSIPPAALPTAPDLPPPTAPEASPTSPPLPTEAPPRPFVIRPRQRHMRG